MGPLRRAFALEGLSAAGSRESDSTGFERRSGSVRIFSPKTSFRRCGNGRTRSPPYPGKQAQAIIEEEFGYPAQELFSAFAEELFAAASIAQVHHATLSDGRSVIVKVQWPDIHGKFVLTGSSVLEAVAGLCIPYHLEIIENAADVALQFAEGGSDTVAAF